MKIKADNKSIIIEKSVDIRLASKNGDFISKLNPLTAYTIEFINIQKIDSIGLAFLVYINNKVKEMGGSLKFVNPPKKLLELAKIFSLSEHIEPLTRRK